MTGLFFLYIASRATATVGRISCGEKETIDRPCEDNPHDDTDYDNDKQLYVHAIKTVSLYEKFLQITY